MVILYVNGARLSKRRPLQIGSMTVTCSTQECVGSGQFFVFGMDVSTMQLATSRHDSIRTRISS